MPRVSVVIPTYNREDVLPRAIDSVLAQTYEDFELFVVDDGSTDDTATVVGDYDDDRLVYLEHEENRGGSAARNTGIEAATGEYLAFLDSDDAWLLRKLERQVEALDARSDDWVAAYCDATFLTPDRGLVSRLAARALERLEPTVPAEGGEELVEHVLADRLHTSAGSTLLARRSAVEAIDGFDESFDRFQDPEFLIRLLRAGQLAHVDEVLVRRYESATPPADVVAAADEHYLQTYAPTVRRLQRRGCDVVSIHRLALAQYYLQEGRFREGYDYLSTARRPTAREFVGIATSALAGVRRRFDRLGTNASAGAVATSSGENE